MKIAKFDGKPIQCMPPEESRRRLRRVAFITRTFAFGGLQRHLIDLVTRLDFDNSEALIVCLGPDAYSEHLQDQKGRVRVRSGLRMSSFWDWVRLFTETKPDALVFVHDQLSAFPLRSYLAAEVARVPRVYSIHHLIPPPPLPPVTGNSLRSRARRLIGYRRRQLMGIKLCSYLSDKTICVSASIAKDLINNYGHSSRKTITVLNGVSLCEESSCTSNPGRVREALRIGPHEPILICVARLDKEKRLDILLKAVARLIERGDFCKCVILGDGPLRSDLSQQIQDLGLSSYVFLEGFKNNVRDYLKECDIFVLPSEREGLPLAILEAMACGLPCVATNVAGNSEAIEHNLTGLIVPPHSVPDLTEALSRLLRDPEERRAMGVVGQKRVKELFDLEVSMERIKTVLLG